MCLYLPKKWTGADDAEYESHQQRERFAQHREDANIPDGVEHRTKLEIAAELIEHTVSADIEHGCVVANRTYGKSRSFREKLRGLDEPYIMDVSPSTFHFVPEETKLLRPEDNPSRTHPAYPENVSPATPEEVADGIGDDEWTEITWNERTQEPMTGEFYRTRIRTVKRKDPRWASDETGWLLLKKDRGGSDEDGELKAWVCWELIKHRWNNWCRGPRFDGASSSSTEISSKISEPTSIKDELGRAFITTSRW